MHENISVSWTSKPSKTPLILAFYKTTKEARRSKEIKQKAKTGNSFLEGGESYNADVF